MPQFQGGECDLSVVGGPNGPGWSLARVLQDTYEPYMLHNSHGVIIFEKLYECHRPTFASFPHSCCTRLFPLATIVVLHTSQVKESKNESNADCIKAESQFYLTGEGQYGGIILDGETPSGSVDVGRQLSSKFISGVIYTV